MKKRAKSWSFRRFIVRALVLLVVAVTAVVFYLGTSGFPDWFLADILQKVDTDPFSLETSKLKLDLWGGLVLSDVKVYRKGVLGPPCIRADRIESVIDLIGMARGESCIRRIRIIDGEICSATAFGEEQEREPLAGLNMDLRLILENCVVDGVSTVNLSSDIECRGTVVQIRDIWVKLSSHEKSGACRGNILYDDKSQEVSGHLETDVDPRYIIPLVRQREWGYLEELIERFSFENSWPKSNLDFVVKREEPVSVYLTGKCWLSDCKYRGIDVLRADGDVEISFSSTNAFVRVDPLLVVRPEGNVRGGLTADFIQHSVGFNGISTMQPEPLMKMVGVYDVDLMNDWRFEGPVKIDAHGIINYQDTNKRALNLSLEGRGVGIGKYVADECAFQMNMADENVSLTNIVGRIFDGAFAGLMGIVLPGGHVTNASYKLEMNIDKADATKVLACISPNDIPDLDGELTCSVKLEGVGGVGSVSKLKGSGRIDIKKGKVYTLPVFGEFSNMLCTIIPGLDFVLTQSDLKADFSIADERIQVSNLQVEGDILSLSGAGYYYFDRRLDFEAQAKLLKAHTVGGKLMRVITYPISKLFEFKLSGNLDKPKWYPVNFSSDLLENIGLKKKAEVQENVKPAVAPGTPPQSGEDSKNEQPVTP